MKKLVSTHFAFRVFQDAASLKHDPLEVLNLGSKFFPRLPRRGLIEALLAVQQTAGVDFFPRLPRRGLIEADCIMLTVSRTPSFRVFQDAASLKLGTEPIAQPTDKQPFRVFQDAASLKRRISSSSEPTDGTLSASSKTRPH